MSDTRLEDYQRCPCCDAMVDPASLADVAFHFFDGACVAGGEKRPELDGITGQKVTPDA